jgi:hypothetical protein
MVRLNGAYQRARPPLDLIGSAHDPVRLQLADVVVVIPELLEYRLGVLALEARFACLTKRRG